MAASKKKKSVKRPQTVTVKITIPSDLHFFIRRMADEELRSVSKQVQMLLEFAMKVIEESSQQGDEPECTTDAIGFHVDPPAEEDEEYE